MRWLPVLLGLAGCGRLGFESRDDARGDGPRGDGGGAGDASVACTCADATIEVNHTSQTGTGSPAMADRGLEGSCGGAGGAEAVLQIRAQVAGTYSVRMAQAGPTVFYVRDGCCTGPELGCSTAPMVASSFPLAAGQVIVVIADGMSVGQTALFDVAGGP